MYRVGVAHKYLPEPGPRKDEPDMFNGVCLVLTKTNLVVLPANLQYHFLKNQVLVVATGFDTHVSHRKSIHRPEGDPVSKNSLR